MDNEFLVEIKNLGREGRIEEAVLVCEKLGDDPVAQSVAHYSLGILFHMNGPKMDLDRAEAYYLEAEKGGPYAAWATYWLGKLYMEKRAFSLALDRFKRVADEDASAAYWTFRILHENPELATSTDEARTYLDLAERLGHIEAKRIDIMERLKLKRGLIPFVKAVGDFLRLFPQAYGAVKNNEKFLYQ